MKFTIIGSGQTYAAIRQLAGELQIHNVTFLERAEYTALPDFIASADVCLGIFGNTGKTQRVIPNKVYEYAAMAKPIITSDTPAVRELFNEQEIMLIRNDDPEILADAIVRLQKDPDLRNRLAENGYRKFVNSATPEILGQQLKNIIEKL